MRDRQVLLEREARDKQAEEYLTLLSQLQTKGTPTYTKTYSSLADHGVIPLSEKIKEWMESWESKRGVRSVAYQKVRGLDPVLLAYAVLSIGLSRAGAYRDGPVSATSLSRAVGRFVEQEACYAKLRTEKPKVWAWLTGAGHLDRGAFHWRAKSLDRAVQWSELDWEGWSAKDQLHVGAQLLDLLENSLGLIQMESIRKGRHKQQNVYRLTPKATAWLERRALFDAFAEPWYMPMIEAPQPWSGPTGGGYLTTTLQFVKTYNTDWLEGQTGRDLSPVYSAMNTIQETPYVISSDVLVVAEHGWTADWHVKGTAPVDPEPEPEKPLDAEPGSEEYRTWKARLSRTRHYNAQHASRRFSLLSLLRTAKQFRDDVLYFPVQLDTRGRVYSLPRYLQPQGPDAHKALLSYAERKRVETPAAWAWLKRHGANVWGMDKAPYREREAWVDDNLDLIEAVAADPISQREWVEADKPFQFLAWCFDYVEALEKGSSALPVAMDGTCSGLQHYSAMLRDPVGAGAVNLLPSDRPQDIYESVAQRLRGRLLQLAEEGGAEESMARQWLASGLVGRDLCKRPTMTTPYGVTAKGVNAQTWDWLAKLAAGRDRLPFEDETGGPACAFITPLIIQAIQGTVPRAMQAMDVLREAASVRARAGYQGSWMVPGTGFHVIQEYHNTQRQRVRITLHTGKRDFWLRTTPDAPSVSVRKSRSAVPPNLVHSLDAAHLMLTVNRLRDEAETPISVSVVHDSFACHAADAPLMARVLREEFVRLYEENDVLAGVLADLREGLTEEQQAKMPAAPEPGDLDLKSVLASPYFFS